MRCRAMSVRRRRRREDHARQCPPENPTQPPPTTVHKLKEAMDSEQIAAAERAERARRIIAYKQRHDKCEKIFYTLSSIAPLQLPSSMCISHILSSPKPWKHRGVSPIIPAEWEDTFLPPSSLFRSCVVLDSVLSFAQQSSFWALTTTLATIPHQERRGAVFSQHL